MTPLSKFIKRSNNIHADKYNYSKSIYKNMKTKVIIICPIHGEFNQTPDSHLSGQGCPDKECIRQKTIKSNLKKYGVEHPLQSNKVQEKMKQTLLKKYGVENISNLPEFRRKAEQTNLKKYGIKHAASSKEIKEKTIKSNLNKYGVNYPSQLKEVQEKIAYTNIQRYGFNRASKSKEIKEKTIKSNLNKYGVNYPSQNQDIKNRLKSKNFIKYGIDHPNKAHLIIENYLKLNYEFIRTNFIFNQTLDIKSLVSFIGWVNPSPAYKLCRLLGVPFIPNHTSGGFDPRKEATLYYLYDPQEDLYKIGITNKDIYSRFGKNFIQDRKIEILNETNFINGQDAYLAEQEILEAFSIDRCTNESWPEDKGGKTEFFNRDILNLNTKENNENSCN